VPDEQDQRDDDLLRYDPRRGELRNSDEDDDEFLEDEEFGEEYDQDEYEDEGEYDEDYVEEPAPRRRGSFKGAVLGLFLGLVLSLGAILAAASVGRASGVAGSTFNVLVLGTDQRPDERGGDPGRTDSIMLVSVSRGGSAVSMVSIPRDLWVPIPGYGEGRINTAYRSAELKRAGSGPGVAAKAVGDALGIHVDRYALVDMTGVRDIVNQVGGIDLDVPEAIIDPEFPTDDYGTMSLTIPAGRQHLNGDLALAYARTRHQDSDFGRMARQQQVIGAILNRAMNPGMIVKLPTIYETLSRAVRTDLAPLDMTSVGLAATSVSSQNVRRLVIGPDLVTSVSGADGASLLQPKTGLRAAVADFLDERS